jgi:type VI secretion system VgrG family protein
MATYTQTNRPLSVTTPLGKDVLLLIGIQGREAISQLFELQLDLLAKTDADVAFDRIVGQSVTVSMPLPEGGTRYFNGIIRRFEQGGRNEDFGRFRAELVPEFWLWMKKVQSRIFQHLTIPDILKQVLNGLSVDFQIKGTYQPRDYCVQYRESDFAFASRLMEEEGIYYYFEHTADSHKLIVRDDPLQHADVTGPSSVIYEEVEGGLRKEQRVTDWTKTQKICSGKYTLWDHHFELTGQNLEAKESILAKVAAGKVDHKLTVGGNERLEIYEYPGAFAQRFDGVDKSGGPQPADVKKVFDDGKRTAKIRMEQEAASAVQIRGASGCEQFAAGHRFALTRHFDGDGKYLLTGVEHSARLGDVYRSGAESTYEYQNSFTAIPAALPYRPQRVTPKPVISGTQTATVVGMPGQEIFLDKYGRIKVQFPWDRQGKLNADSSCWLRVSQLWAGNGWGSFFWPRVGQEVVVTFEEGDPDRPIKSCTVKGKPARDFNQIIFHDEQDAEYLQLHSEKYVSVHNEHSQHEYMPATSFKVIGNSGMPTGSGGGGGLLSDLGSLPHWGGLHLESGSYQYVYGDNVQLVSRLWAPANNFQWFYGTNMQIVMDPMSFLIDYIPIVGPFLELFGVNGNLQATLGNNIQLSYGVAHQITRGPQLTYNTSHPLYQSGSTVEVEVANAISTLSLLASETGLILSCLAAKFQGQAPGTPPGAKDDAYQDTRNDLGAATNWIIGFIWGLVVILEQGIARLSSAAKLSDEAANLMAQGVMNPLAADQHISQATTNVTDSADLLSAAIQKSSGLLNLAQQVQAPGLNNYNEDHVFVAPSIGLIAIRDSSDPQVEKSSNIVIDAQGGDENGTVFINASEQTMISCGPTRIRQSQAGEIDVDAGPTPDGTIWLTCGLAGTGTSIRMTPTTMVLSIGLPGLGPSITITETGIMLQVGPMTAMLGPSGWTCPPNVPEIH